MKISVVMAAWNSQETIAYAIESFLEQDHPSRELIVVDGASSDRTCKIVEGFGSPLISVSSEPDNGIYDAMNKGLAKVTGDAFGCLNSDDRYARRDSLSLIAAALEFTDLVSGTLHFVREHDGSNPVRCWVPEVYRTGAYRKGYTLPHPTTYARRCVLDRVGPFNTSYRSAGDYDWLMRALVVEGFSHSIIGHNLVDMRLGGQSTGGLKAVIKNSKEMLSVRREHLGVRGVDLALFLNLHKKLRQLQF